MEYSEGDLLEAALGGKFDRINTDWLDGLRGRIVVSAVGGVLEKCVFRDELRKILGPIDQRNAELNIRGGGNRCKWRLDTLEAHSA